MIEDIKGNQISGDLGTLKSMLSSMMQENVTKTEIPDTNKSKEMGGDQIKKISEMLLKLDKSFNVKEISDSIRHLNQVVSSAQNSEKSVIKEIQGSFKNIDSSLSKMFGGLGGMQQAIEKGTSDLSSNVLRVIEKNSNATGTGDLKNILSSIGSIAKEMIKSTRSMAKSPSDGGLGDNITGELETINATEQAEKGLRTKNYTQLTKLAESGLKKGSMHVRDDELIIQIKKLNKTIDGIYTHLLSLPPPGTPSPPPPGPTPPGGGGKWGMIGSLASGLKSLTVSAYSMAKKYAGDLVTDINTAMAVPNFNDTVLLGARTFKEGLVKITAEQRKIAIQAKQIAYETDGITGATKDLQAEYLVTANVEKRTGVDRLTFQNKLLEFQRKGIKDQGALKDLVATQLNIEKQLGMEAGELGDDFIKLKQQAGFTNVQIASTARGMLEVARQSGLSGKELKAAMESSKGIIDAMKNAATLTAGAIKNVTSVMAEAQKLGVTEQVGNLMQSAASSSKLFLNTSQETKTLLYQAAGSVGRISDLQNGILTKSKAGLKDLGQGMDNVLRRFNVDGVDALENLTDEAKMKLNINLQAAYKMDLGEFTRTAKAFKDGAKGYNERLKEINDKLKENGDTALSNEERKALEIKKASLQQQASMDILTKFDESLKGAGTGAAGMKKGMEKFNAELIKNKDLQDQISGLALEKGIQGPLSTEQQVGLGLEASVANLNKKMADLKMDPSKQIDEKKIQQALADPKQFKDLVADMQKMEQEAMTAEKAASDPVLQGQQKMLELNDKISIGAQQTAERAANLIDGQAVFAASLAQSLIQEAEQTGLLSKIQQGIGWIWGVITSLPGMFTSMIGRFTSGVGSLFTRSGLTNAITGLGKRIPMISGIVDAGTRLMEGQSVAQAATGGVSTFGGAAGGAALGTMVAGPIGTVIGGIIGAFVGSGLGDIAYEYMVKPFIELLPTIWTAIKDFFGWLGQAFFPAMFGAIWTPIKWVLDSLGLTDLLYNNIWKPISDTFASIGNAVWDWIKPIWNAITSIFSDLSSWFGGWGKTIWDFLYKGASAVGLGWLLGKGDPPKGAKPVAAPSEPTIDENSFKANLLNATAMTNQAQTRATALSAAAYTDTDFRHGSETWQSRATAVPAGMSTSMATPATGPSGVMTPPQRQAAMATTTSGSAGDMGSYLASIAKSGETEASASQQMIQLMQKMIEVLSSGGNGGAKPAYAGAPAPKSDNYFKLPTGNFNESSIREVTNL